MKATLSWLSVQPLTVKTTEEGGVGGVSLARSAPPGVNFQLSFSSQRRIGAATSGSVTARGCLSTTGAQGLPCPAPCLHHPAVLREGQVPDGRGHPGGDRHSEGDTQATRCC